MVTQGKAKRTITLTFNHETEGPVFVAGSFNNWDVGATPMKRRRNGCWEARLKLPPGEYEFRYFANGQWFTDYAADGVMPNGLGDFNSLLKVADKIGTKARQTAAS